MIGADKDLQGAFGFQKSVGEGGTAFNNLLHRLGEALLVEGTVEPEYGAAVAAMVGGFDKRAHSPSP